jgi:hypothetical protein
MLLSTKILLQYNCRTLVAREWRVVNLAEEEGDSVDIATFFNGISLEPFSPSPSDQVAPVWAAIETSQDSPFQDILLTVRVAEVTAMFGVYIKFFIIHALAMCRLQEA